MAISSCFLQLSLRVIHQKPTCPYFLSSPGPLASPRSTTSGGFTWALTQPRSVKPVPGEGLPARQLQEALGSLCRTWGVVWGAPPCLLASLQAEAGRVGGGQVSAAPAPQVWLCHHAEVTQQDDSRETVGAALDQELSVWGAVAESAPQLSLSRRRGASSPMVTSRPHTELEGVGLCPPFKRSTVHTSLSRLGMSSSVSLLGL